MPLLSFTPCWRAQTTSPSREAFVLLGCHAAWTSYEREGFVYTAADARNQAPLPSTFAYAIWRFKNTLTMRVKWKGALARWQEAPCNKWPGISCNSGMKNYCKNGDEKLILTHLLFVLLIKILFNFISDILILGRSVQRYAFDTTYPLLMKGYRRLHTASDKTSRPYPAP